MNLPEFAVRRRITTLMTFFAALVVGAVCLAQLPLDLLPEMEIPAITVTTAYEGAAPEDVEENVTEPLERALSTVPDLKHITSISREGSSVITLSFEWGTDLDTRSNEVRDLVGMAERFLPEDVDKPNVLKFDIARFPILVYGVTAKESYPRIEDILEDEVASPLKRIPGVAAAFAMSPLHRQVNVDLDRERLAAVGLTPREVALAIARENEDTPAGSLQTGLTDYIVRVPGEFETVHPMSRVVLAGSGGSLVRLSDVGTVEDGFEEKTLHVTINDGPGAVLMIQKESGANTVTVARAVHRRLEELKPALPPDIQIINVMDFSEDIEIMVTDLGQALFVGGALAMLVVLVFLRRWRAALVIGLTLPFSLIIAISAVYFLGYTINMMTLFALIIAIGMVVDNAIVVLENVTRHREAGERPREGAVYGTSEVAMAVTASTLTTVCIFAPLVFVKGLIKIFFSEFAVVVTVTLCASLFSALTLTPMLSSVLFGRGRFRRSRGGFFEASERAFDRLAGAYGDLLRWALGHRALVLLAAGLFFASSVAVAALLGREFMPEEDRSFVSVAIEMPVGTRVEETARVLEAIDRELRDVIPAEERVATYSRCGSEPGHGGPGGGEEGAHLGFVGYKLVRKVRRGRHVTEIARAMRERIDARSAPLGVVKYRVDMMDPLSSMMAGGERRLTVNILGDDVETTDRLAEEVRRIVASTPGTVDVSVSRVRGRPEFNLAVDREAASALGLNPSDVGDAVRSAFYGRTASTYRIHGDEYDVFVRLREADRTDPQDILATPVRLPGPGGGLIRAAAVADLGFDLGPVEIERKDQGRIVNVTGEVSGRSLGEVVSDIEAELAKLDVPADVEVEMGGQAEEMRTSFFWMAVALVVGMILVYMVMASQFESLLHPFVVMFAVPFAFTGAIWAVFLGGHHVSIVVLLGLLLLIGIVVNNAIVLVDYINILRERGLEVGEAIRQAGAARLRPVLMTALTTVAALLPMAFTQGEGSESWNPLGLSVLGGLLVSTLVTLVLIPVVYSLATGLTRAVWGAPDAAAEGERP